MEEQVIAIHDEVMPKLGTLNKYKSLLSSNLETIEDNKIKREAILAMKDLADADEAMMSWMAEWKVPEDEDARKIYLENEMIKIKEVKEKMLSSMKKSEELLNLLNIPYKQ